MSQMPEIATVNIRRCGKSQGRKYTDGYKTKIQKSYQREYSLA